MFVHWRRRASAGRCSRLDNSSQAERFTERSFPLSSTDARSQTAPASSSSSAGVHGRSLAACCRESGPDVGGCCCWRLGVVRSRARPTRLGSCGTVSGILVEPLATHPAVGALSALSGISAHEVLRKTTRYGRTTKKNARESVVVPHTTERPVSYIQQSPPSKMKYVDR